MSNAMRLGLLVAIALVCAGCAQLPPASLPEVPPAAAFKELRGQSTEPVISNEAWWQIYQDEELNALQQRLLANSPDLASALARYQQARAAGDALRSAQSPTLNASLGAQRNRQSERRPLRVLGPTSPDEYNSATLGLDLQYELDLWGRVRQQVSAGEAETQAAQADLAGARLALQAQLADSWIALRSLDREIALLSATATSFAKAVELVGQRHRGGISNGLDLARAQAQMEGNGSQLSQQRARRAVLEHAVAALVGANPSAYAVEPKLFVTALPVLPTGLPSELLQRRPDIAAAQRRVLAANASLGVARAAFFPSLMLSLQGGLQSSDLRRLIEAPNLFWAIGPELVSQLLDGGRRKADQARAEAVLDETGQRYRSVVLAAFQQVEDQLALLADYGEAAAAERRAVAASQRALDLAINRYREGAVSYLEVVASQTVLLQAQRGALDLETRQRRATVQLARALGGGWSQSFLQEG